MMMEVKQQYRMREDMSQDQKRKASGDLVMFYILFWVVFKLDAHFIKN